MRWASKSFVLTAIRKSPTRPGGYADPAMHAIGQRRIAIVAGPQTVVIIKDIEKNGQPIAIGVIWNTEKKGWPIDAAIMWHTERK